MSGYGREKALSQDEVKKFIREIDAQMRKRSQLEDIKKLMEDTKSLGDIITKLFATPPETTDDTITGSY